MKTRIFSSLLAVLLFSLCLSKTFAQDEKTYSHVSLKTPPTYPGGIQKFYEWLGTTIKYPAMAAEKNVQGTVYISFTIEKDGALTDIKSDGRKVGYGLEEEAIRVMKLSKRWNPGILAGKPVRTKYNIPVKFTMPNKKPNPATAMATTPSTPTNPNDETIYDHVSLKTPPTYPGGIQKFYDFMGRNLTYPKAAADNKVKGTVFLTFNIEKDGSVSDVKTIGKKLGSGMDEEAIRVVKLTKKWNPGLLNGTPVRVKYNIPVKFTM